MSYERVRQLTVLLVYTALGFVLIRPETLDTVTHGWIRGGVPAVGAGLLLILVGEAWRTLK